jgi:hypothetical protein
MGERMSLFLKFTLVIMATFSTLAHAVKRGNAVEGLNSRRNLGDENLFHGTAAATDIFLRASVHDKIAQEDNLFHETDPSPPSDSICVTDENGVYGSEVEGGLIPLTYYFELEVNRSEEVTEVVLPAIENAIIDRLLALFVQVCGGTSRLGSTRRLELVGLASSPQDTIFEGCKSIIVCCLYIYYVMLQYTVHCMLTLTAFGVFSCFFLFFSHSGMQRRR